MINQYKGNAISDYKIKNLIIITFEKFHLNVNQK